MLFFFFRAAIVVSAYAKPHVANASGQTISVEVSARLTNYSADLSACVSASGDCNADLNARWGSHGVLHDMGMFKLASDNFVEIEGGYISVYTSDDNNKPGEPVCRDYKIPGDR